MFAQSGEQPWADPFDRQQILEPVEWTVAIAVGDDAVGQHGSDPGELFQRRRVGGVEVDGRLSRLSGGTSGNGEAFTVTKEPRLIQKTQIRGGCDTARRDNGVRRASAWHETVQARARHRAVNLNDELSGWG